MLLNLNKLKLIPVAAATATLPIVAKNFSTDKSKISSEQILDNLTNSPVALSNQARINNSSSMEDNILNEQEEDSLDLFFRQYENVRCFDKDGNLTIQDDCIDNIEEQILERQNCIDSSQLKKVCKGLSNDKLKTIANIAYGTNYLNMDMINLIKDVDFYYKDSGNKSIKIEVNKILSKSIDEINKAKEDELSISLLDDIMQSGLLLSLSLFDADNNIRNRYVSIKSMDVYTNKIKESSYFASQKLYKSLLQKNPNLKFNQTDFCNGIRREVLIKLLQSDELSPKLLNKLYKESLIAENVDFKLRKKLVEINNKYNVKIFLSTSTNRIGIDTIEKELEAWTKASNGKAILPKSIDLNTIDERFLKKYSDGYAGVKSIKINDINYPSRLKSVLRHEITHLNTKNVAGLLNRQSIESLLKMLSSLKKDKEAERYQKKLEVCDLLDDILAKKYIKKADGTFMEVIDYKNCKYREEFFNAGLSDTAIRYAYVNPKEFLAVASEGDFSKYSPQFKKILIKIGLPEYVFRLDMSGMPLKYQIATESVRKRFPNEHDFDKLLKYREQILERQNTMNLALFHALFKMDSEL